MDSFDNNGRPDSKNNAPDYKDGKNSDVYGLLYGNPDKDRSAPPEKEFADEFGEPKKNNNAKITTVLAITLAVIACVAFIIFKSSDKKSAANTTAATFYGIKETDAVMTAHIYYDANGGEAEFYEKTAVIGDNYDQFPSVTREGYLFEGWFDERDGGERVYTDTPIRDSSETVYAHWYEETTVMTTESTTKATTKPPEKTTSAKAKTTTATAKSAETTTSTTVVALYHNADLVVLLPDGFITLVHPEHDEYYTIGAMEEKQCNDYIEVNYYYATSNYSAAAFAESYAEEISATVYTRTVNGLTFSCVDSYDNTLGYKTIMYYICNGHLIIIEGYSKISRARIWSMFEKNIYPA